MDVHPSSFSKEEKRGVDGIEVIKVPTSSFSFPDSKIVFFDFQSSKLHFLALFLSLNGIYLAFDNDICYIRKLFKLAHIKLN